MNKFQLDTLLHNMISVSGWLTIFVSSILSSFKKKQNTASKGIKKMNIRYFRSIFVTLLTSSIGLILACSNEIPSGHKIDVPHEDLKDDGLRANLTGGTQMDFVWIEEGSFVMGSPIGEEGRNSDELQHTVTLSKGFYLGKYEVTQGQWESVMNTRPWLDENRTQLDDIIFGEMNVISGSNYPAVYVSWQDAQSFINRLNREAGLELYRLPTEAEWEYAARAGTTTRWSFGESQSLLSDYAWYEDNTWDVGSKHAHPVGLKNPNQWGLHDMYGNVWEWCQDKYGYYGQEEKVDPQGPSAGLYHVMRGGSFNYGAQSISSAHRGSEQQLLSYGFRSSYHGGLGFRLLRIQ